MFNKNISKQLTFWNNNVRLKQALIKVNQVIQKNIALSKSTLNDALSFNFQKTGKMLRPALILLFSQFGNNKDLSQEKMLKIAAAIEMLHNATLIHDDIIDESSLRRGQASIQEKFGKHIAVYAGDFLFAASLTLLSENAKVMKSIRTNSKTMEKILQGEVHQYDNSFNTNIGMKEYLQQIKGKTAVLFGLSAFLGCFEGGSGLIRSRYAKRFGEQLGIAFQLRDDILDYTSSSKNFKKPVLLDVRDGVYSGPLILALAKDKGKLLKLVKKGRQLSQPDLKQIQTLVHSLGGVDKAQKLADKYGRRALWTLDLHFPHDQLTASIKKLTFNVLQRTY